MGILLKLRPPKLLSSSSSITTSSPSSCSLRNGAQFSAIFLPFSTKNRYRSCRYRRQPLHTPTQNSKIHSCSEHVLFTRTHTHTIIRHDPIPIKMPCANRTHLNSDQIKRFDQIPWHFPFWTNTGDHSPHSGGHTHYAN